MLFGKSLIKTESPILLLLTVVLNSKDSECISEWIINCLNNIGVKGSNVMLGVSDGVPVMKCGFNLLKERGIIPLDTPRVNCLTHNLNLVLKKIKDL